MYACICRGITEGQVRAAGREGVVGKTALIRLLGLDDAACCGRCVAHIEEFVELACEGAAETAPAAACRPALRPSFA